MKVNEKVLRWLMLAVIVVCFACNYAGVFDKKMDQNGDNYVYFQLARSLARGEGYVSVIGPVPEPHMHFPPGYPVFLSLFFPFFPDNVVALKLLNGFLLLASILLLFRIVRKTTGRQGHWIALAACLLTACHPELLRWSTILMSEMLYTTLTLGIIALCLDLDLEKIRQKDIRHILMLAGLCLLVAAVYFVRTMGISIVLALALTFLIQGAKAFLRRKKETTSWGVPLLVAGGIILSFLVAKTSWDYRNQRVNPGYTSDYVNTFTSPISGESKDNMAAFWLNRVNKNLQSFVPYYIPNVVLNPKKSSFEFRIQKEDRHWITGILVIAFMLVGVLSMKSLSLLLILYFIMTLGPLMLYPPYYADIRYMIPLVPLMLAALVAGICWTVRFMVQRLSRQKGEPAWLASYLTPALALLAIALLLSPYYQAQQKYRKIAAAKSIGEIPGGAPFQVYLDECATCSQFPEDWIFVARKPEIFYFHSHYRHSIAMPHSGSASEIIDFLANNHVDVIVLDAAYRTSSKVMLPVMVANPDMFQILWQKEDGSGAIVGFRPQKR